MAKFSAKNLEEFEQFIGDESMTIELQNKSGDTLELCVEPLESRHVGKVLYIQNNMPRPRLINPVEVKNGGVPKYEDEESFSKRLKEEEYNIYGKFLDLLSLWIKQTNPDLPDKPLKKIILSNAGVLFEAFNRQHSDVDQDGKSRDVKDFIEAKRSAIKSNEKN